MTKIVPFPHWRGERRLGAFLVKQELLTPEQLAQALERQKENSMRLGSVLVELGFLDDESLANLLSDRFGIPSVVVTRGGVELEAVRLIPFDLLLEHQILPIRRSEKSLTLAMVDPSDREILRTLSADLELRILPVVASQSTILETLDRLKSDLQEDDSVFVGTPEERACLRALFASLEDFQVLAPLAVGGFATVYKCYQRSLDRTVAIKTMFKKKVPYGPIVERFMEEGRVIAKLDHRNIVRVLNQGEFEDIFFIAMEYVEGTTLGEALQHLPLKAKLDIMIQVTDALAYSHAQGVLHRDIKPSNILVDTHRVAKVLDFGIAHFQDRYSKNPQRAHDDFVLGTPRYMAPEQRQGLEHAEDLADLYSVGAVMFEVFTGSRQKPSAEFDPQDLNTEIPTPLAAAIRKCLAENPANRLSNMAALREFLVQLRDRLFQPQAAIQKTLGAVDSEAEAASHEELFRERYDLLSEIKTEGDCRVFLAEHRKRQQLLLIREVNGDSGKREAALLARHSHPHIGEVLGVGSSESRMVVIREYLDGGTLWDRMKQTHCLEGFRVIRILLQVARALEFAQGLSIHHGHLHPFNVLFSRDGQLKVVDFGGTPSCDKSMRRFFEKGPVDQVARDRFSLGVLLFEMIAGRQYFPSQGPDDNFEYLRDRKIDSEDLKKLLRRMWNMVPREDRYPDHHALVEDLVTHRDLLAFQSRFRK
jgi:serine/threonine-protein kinase